MRFLRRRRSDATSMSAFGVTDVGIVRSSNEDNFSVLLGKDAPQGDALLAVADGMGGHASGEIASQIALDALSDTLSKTSSPSEQSFRRAVDMANERVYSASQLDNLRGMGTTLVAVLLVGGVLLICNVGDSRAYLLRAGRLTQLTRDHSWVGDMVARGLLTPEQASVHPRRNVITRALGVGEFVQVDVTRVVLREGDRVLLCSDGLHGQVSQGVIASILQGQSLKRVAGDLVKSAKSAGGDDNITVVVAQVDSAVQAVPAQPENPEDVAGEPGITLAPGGTRPRSVSHVPDSRPPLDVSGSSGPPRRNRLRPLLAAGGFGAVIVILLIVLVALQLGGSDAPPTRRPALALPVPESPTPTPPATGTATPEPTPTPTPSTFTPTPTVTGTPTPAATSTTTPTPAAVQTPTATATATHLPADTSTSTTTPTVTDAPTSPATSTTTSTTTPEQTSTRTPSTTTPTPAAVQTPTATDTATPLPSNTPASTTAGDPTSTAIVVSGQTSSSSGGRPRRPV